MKEAIGIQTQPPDRGTLVKESASPPPSAHGPVLVETPASSPAPSLVKPPATPPQRAPARREASASPAPTTGRASWLLLDRFVHRSKKQRGIYAGDPTTSEVAYDCIGRIVRVSVRIADPPLVSRLYLHWMLKPPLEDVTDPAVVAAHRNSILFNVTVPFEDDSWWNYACSFPIDYFVYSAPTTSSSSNVPSLIRLPPCFMRVVKKREEDTWFQPYHRQQQRCMIDQEMGLLCHGDDGEFTVADLTYRFDDEVELCMIHHSPRSSSVIPMQWRIKKLPTPPDMKIYPNSLTTDTVFPIDGCLCWVDYYQGMLLVDVLRANSDSDNPADQTPLIRYIPLPKQALKSRRPCPDAFSPDPYRHVCITDDGIVKLVCIFTKYSQPTFTIITWSLDIRKGNWWIKDCGTIMRDSEFFSMLDTAHHQSNNHLLPRVIPSFPVVSLADPDVICFLLKEKDVGRNTYWVIEVNMREKVLQSTAMYIREEEEEGYIPGKPRWNFYGQYFVPSMFSSYVGQDVSGSQKISVQMEEKAKQRRAKQEAQLENLLTQKRQHSAKQEGYVVT